MGMPGTTEHWTVAQVRAMPDDGNRYELVSGQLVVTPSPRPQHQIAVRELMRLLLPWLKETGAGQLLASPADISLGEDEVLQPDLFVFRAPSGQTPRDWREITELLLVIEVLSPATARYDRQLKRHRYQRAGVPEYWIVDLDARLIERWRPGERSPEILIDEISWQSSPGASLVIDLPALFREVAGP